MKKILILTLLFLLVSFGAAAADYYPEYSGEPTTITMWAWTSNENYSIDKFEQVYPNIKVKWENISDYYDKAQTALSAGTGLPDVIMIEYSYAPQFMSIGAFQPINNWLDKDTFVELYGEDALGWCAMDDNIYGTPQDSGAMALFYRKDIFDEYDLTVPTNREEYILEAKKLKKAAPDLNFVSPPIGYSMWWIGQVWQAGGKLFDYKDGNWYIDFTNPTAEEVFDFWGKLLDEGTIDLQMYWNPDWYNSLNNGRTAVVELGSWFAEWLKYNATDSEGKWRVALPAQWNKGKQHNSMIGGSGFYVSTQSANPEAAALFVNWLNSHPDSLTQLHNKSNLPVLVSNRFGEVIDQVSGPDKFFGGQNIGQKLWESHKLVNTTFITLPIMSNVDESLSSLLQDYADGKIEKFSDILPMWQESVIGTMQEFGYNNLIIDQLPE
jgi:multiple sugar transport system substrate-binding protein